MTKKVGRPATNKKTSTLYVRIDEKLHERVLEYAVRHRWSVVTAVEVLIERALDKEV